MMGITPHASGVDDHAYLLSPTHAFGLDDGAAVLFQFCSQSG